MDKKKIFILILICILSNNFSLAAEVTLDIKRDEISIFSKDPDLNGKKMDFKQTKNIKGFEYFLITQEIINKEKEIKKINFKNSFIINFNNIEEKNKFNNALKSNYSQIKFKNKELKDFNREIIKEKNLSYFLKRETDKNFISSWHFKKTIHGYVIQKTFNELINKNKDNLLFYYDIIGKDGLLKINFIYEINNKRKVTKYIDEVAVSSDNEFNFKNDFENKRSYGFVRSSIKDYIKDYDNKEIRLKEIVLFSSKENFSKVIKSMRYKLYKFENNEYFLENLDKKQFIIPAKQIKLVEEIKNINSNNSLKNNLEFSFIDINNFSEKITYNSVKTYWESSLLTLYKILSDEKGNVAIYIPNIEDQKLKSYVAENDFFSVNYLLKLMLNTMLFLILLTLIFSIRVKMINKYLDKIIKSNMILLTVIFLLYILDLFFGLYSITIINSVLGMIVFINLILIIFIKNNHNLNNEKFTKTDF